jgi:hypothetical protein
MAGQFFARDFFKQGFWAAGFWANTAEEQAAPPGVVFSDPPIQIMQDGSRKRRKPTDLLLLLLT